MCATAKSSSTGIYTGGKEQNLCTTEVLMHDDVFVKRQKKNYHAQYGTEHGEQRSIERTFTERLARSSLYWPRDNPAVVTLPPATRVPRDALLLTSQKIITIGSMLKLNDRSNRAELMHRLATVDKAES